MFEMCDRLGNTKLRGINIDPGIYYVMHDHSMSLTDTHILRLNVCMFYRQVLKLHIQSIIFAFHRGDL